MDETTLTAQTHIHVTYNTGYYIAFNTHTETHINFTRHQQTITSHHENKPQLLTNEPAIRKCESSEVETHDTFDNIGMGPHRKPNLKKTSNTNINTTNQLTFGNSNIPQTGTGKSRQELSFPISATDDKIRLDKINKSQLANDEQIRPNQILGHHKHQDNMSSSSTSRNDSSKKRKSSRSRYGSRFAPCHNSLAQYIYWVNQHSKRGCPAHPSRCKTYLWVKTPHVTRGCIAHPSGCKTQIIRGCYAHPYGCKSNTKQPVPPNSNPYNPIFYGPLDYPCLSRDPLITNADNTSSNSANDRSPHKRRNKPLMLLLESGMPIPNYVGPIPGVTGSPTAAVDAPPAAEITAEGSPPQQQREEIQGSESPVVDTVIPEAPSATAETGESAHAQPQGDAPGEDSTTLDNQSGDDSGAEHAQEDDTNPNPPPARQDDEHQPVENAEAETGSRNWRSKPT